VTDVQTYDWLAKTTADGNSTSLTIENISQLYKCLVVTADMETNSSSSGISFSFKLNGQTGSNYSYIVSYGTSSGSYAAGFDSSGTGVVNYSNGTNSGNTNTDTADGLVWAWIPYYAEANLQKMIGGYSVGAGSSSSHLYHSRFAVTYKPLFAPVTSLSWCQDNGSNIAYGCEFNIWGLR
tara:strand:+ start:1333 stop:1872 length:540 start_codon:yes stop_codon:yes gene_type:complete